MLHTFNGVFIFLGYNLLRTIYDDNFEPDVEVQIDGNMFQGMRGRVMFSKVSRSDRVREGRGGAVGWLLPHQLFSDLEAHPSWMDFPHFPIYQLLSTFFKASI